jgi:hypothetical protein
LYQGESALQVVAACDADLEVAGAEMPDGPHVAAKARVQLYSPRIDLEVDE